MKDQITHSKRILVKIGTRVLVNETGRLVLSNLSSIVEQISHLHKEGREVLVVTSAAVALGKQTLGMSRKLELHEKQACAAIGQSRLINRYSDAFSNSGITAAQVLLTDRDLTDPESVKNLRSTIDELFRMGVVPIINENDSISTKELKENPKNNSFGDNDQLSAILASELSSDLLIILTNVNGLFKNGAKIAPDLKPIAEILDFSRLDKIDTSVSSPLGRGGMASKIKAAQYAATHGVNTVLTSGLRIRSIADLFNGQFDFATLVPAQKN